MQRETIDAGSPVPRPLGVRLGSLACALSSAPPRYGRMLASLFGTDLVPLAALSGRCEVEISIRESAIPFKGLPTDRLTISRTERGRRLETDPLTCDVHLDRTPRIEFSVRQPDMADDRLAYHFWILTNRCLLLLDRVVLHAAAIALGESVLLFCGSKGAGKSTLSVSLATAGAVILAEDHVVVRRSGEELLVSGCSGRLRVTPQTERHFLRGRLPADAVDVPGTRKKEFQGHHLFATRPYVDCRPHRLFFNRVGTAYGIRPLSRKEALLGLIRHTSALHRFGGPDDYADFLALLSDLSVRIPAFDLELSDRLKDLDHLARRLS
jgi:hypothetical protein